VSTKGVGYFFPLPLFLLVTAETGEAENTIVALSGTQTSSKQRALATYLCVARPRAAKGEEIEGSLNSPVQEP
jgi:hypothetical protein